MQKRGKEAKGVGTEDRQACQGRQLAAAAADRQTPLLVYMYILFYRYKFESRPPNVVPFCQTKNIKTS